MNPIVRVGGCLLVAILLCGGAVAEELPVMIRVYVEFIEVPHDDLPAVMKGLQSEPGHALHARVRRLARQKRAHILESIILVAQPGQRATSESIMEYVYPTEYEPGGLGFVPTPIPPTDFPRFVRSGLIDSFETRNVGVTLEIEPNLGADGNVIDLRLSPEIVGLQRLDNWHEHVDQWGSAHAMMPVFDSKRVSVGVTLRAGKFAFLGLLAPVKGGSPESGVRIMVFVRADVVKMEGKGGGGR